jgi:hypothetical protein
MRAESTIQHFLGSQGDSRLADELRRVTERCDQATPVLPPEPRVYFTELRAIAAEAHTFIAYRLEARRMKK